MRVVDTSAWIEYLSDSHAGRIVGQELPSPENWIVPTIVQLELVKFFTRKVGERTADEVFAISQGYAVIPLDAKIAFAAAEVCRLYRLATADAIIYATAQRLGADLLTCDAHFKELDGVRYVPKSAAAVKPDEAGS
ncbi:type II toxin-antitoxin system VapC family toxin [Pleomorphomonas oryzae]|uniref:type II toxin-antitoxin system VapC family toxin n=1 Tax=Pleomorphomonas oryzae TaxID=261934 RepID=UPI0004191699|nr:type II toxin-antitoxin system VapC family toxin [Pleomorphomonas oryzae]